MRLFWSMNCCKVQAYMTLLLCNEVVHRSAHWDITLQSTSSELVFATHISFDAHLAQCRRYCASSKKSVEGVPSLNIKHGGYPIPREAKVMNPNVHAAPFLLDPQILNWLQSKTLERRVFQD